MEAQELRGGNKIWRPCCYDEVLEIRENGIIGLDSLRGLIPYSEIEPIPITDELLLKIGFILPEHKEFYVMCCINGKDNSIRLTRYFNLWNAKIFASHPEVVMLEHIIKGLRFVHELQNAYYLVSGKELEIKI